MVVNPMVAIMDGRPLIERIKARCEFLGLGVKGPLGVVSSFAKSASVETNRDIVAVATTDDLDLEEEVVVPGGADLSYFQKNKKVFVDHTYDTMHAVGVLRRLTAWHGHGGAEGWLARVNVPESENPLSSHVLALAAEGIGMSIGFEAIDYGRPTADEQKAYPGVKSIVRRWKWIELSFTAMPCNVSCQTLSGHMDTSKAAATRAMLVKSKAPRMAFQMLNLEFPMLDIPPMMMHIS